MDIVGYILDGLEAELELERELGVRVIECDRELLKIDAGGVPLVSAMPPLPNASSSVSARSPSPTASSSVSAMPSSPTAALHPVLFLHDRPLSPAGVEMMSKIITALGMTAETAPIFIEKPLPKATVVVVLGGLALRKFLPAMRGAPGQWLRTQKGTPVLVTYSPEYILRFKEVTPAVKKIKQDMWRSLKDVLRRARSV